MVHKKINLETAKVGKKCIISFKGNDMNHVTFFGKKNRTYLFKDQKDSHKIFALSKSEAERLVFTIIKDN